MQQGNETSSPGTDRPEEAIRMHSHRFVGIPKLDGKETADCGLRTDVRLENADVSCVQPVCLPPRLCVSRGTHAWVTKQAD